MIRNSSKKRARKYFAPQNEGVKHICDHKGCNKEGEFKAPKDRSLKSYYWFCLEHVQEYNSKWNYYIDEETPQEDEQEAFKKKARFGGFHSRIKYKFGCNLGEDLEFLHGFSDYKQVADEIRFSKKDNSNMEMLNISKDEFTLENLKKQYKKLAKICHPDLHPEDKDAEEKFKKLTQAYKQLMDKLSN